MCAVDTAPGKEQGLPGLVEEPGKRPEEPEEPASILADKHK